MSAGEIIGTAGGEERGSFDIGMTDSRIQSHQYANPGRWSGFNRAMITVCPTEYFSSDVKTTLEEKLGEHIHDGTLVKRTIEPICGQLEQDEPGTAQGVWFVKGTINTIPEEPHMSLVHEAYDPDKSVFSMGNSVPGVDSGRYYFDPLDEGLVNIDFIEVTLGNVYCYELHNKWYPDITNLVLIIQMPTETILKIEKLASESCGAGPWSFTDPAEFER